MEEYEFEKDEYCYYAAFLIFGEDAPRTQAFHHLVMEPFKEKDIRISKICVQKEGDLSSETLRTIEFYGSKVGIRSSGTFSSSGINTSLKYFNFDPDGDKAITVHDALFKDVDFKRFDSDWEEYSQSKIKYLSVLIKAVYEKAPFDLSRCVRDFPNIATAIFEHVYTKSALV